jgi:hypothetical protein
MRLTEQAKRIYMQTSRSSDLPNLALFSRTARIIVEAGSYYYKTREGEIRGGFDSELLALRDLRVFIKVIEIEIALEKTDLFMAQA